MRIISVLSFVTLLLIVIAFACVNAQIVTINYYVGEIHIALCLALAIALAAGALIGMLMGLWILIKQKQRQLGLKHELHQLTQQLHSLRANSHLSN